MDFIGETSWHILIFIILIVIYQTIYYVIILRLERRSKAAPLTKIDSCLTFFERKYGRSGFVKLKKQKIRLHYVSSGDETNPMMLMIHGYPEFWQTWEFQIPEFQSDYWIVIPDLRGYGLSDKPANNYSISNLADDMEELITMFEKDSAIVIGHGFGGMVACILAQKFPDIVNKLIIIDAPFPGSLIYSYAWWFNFRLPVIVNILLLIKSLFRKEKLSNEYGSNHVIRNEIKAYHRKDCYTLKDNYCDLKTKEIKKQAMLTITSPALIIWGENDFFDFYTSLENYYKHCNNIRTERIGNAGHWVHIEQPQIVNASINKFLQEVDEN